MNGALTININHSIFAKTIYFKFLKNTSVISVSKLSLRSKKLVLHSTIAEIRETSLISKSHSGEMAKVPGNRGYWAQKFLLF